MDYSQFYSQLGHIAVSLAIGLLVGSERGWHGRELTDGGRVAGIRTFPLIALLGGIVAVATFNLAEFQRWLILASVFLPLVILITAGYYQASQKEGNFSVTTAVSALLVFWLGALPAFGLSLPAAAIAVVMTLLLHSRNRLHYWLKILDEKELLGTLQFLLVSVVILPLLPNEGFGPWQALNPFQLWWMVVLISGLSVVGYFAMRMVGSRKGITATSLTGGLVSSTAVTLNLSRLHSEVPTTHIIACGILLACATMFGRVLVVVGVVKQSLLLPMALPMLAGFVILLIFAWLLWRKSANPQNAPESDKPAVHNPFQLIPALKFAGLLAAVMLAAEALQQGFGESGLYALAFFTGLADVDPIVLSLAPKSGDTLARDIIVMSISLAAATNTLMKGVYCRFIAGPQLGWQVLRPALLASVVVILTASSVLWWQ